MEDEYIVLRDLRPTRRRSPVDIPTLGFDVGLRPFDVGVAAEDPPEPKIEVERLDPNDVIELHRDPQVRVTAKKMPLVLIKPLGSAKGSDEREWGIRAVGADKSKLSGEDVVVAVLDSGIDREHEAFRGVDLTVKDFTGTGDGDELRHGTHCAGTIFGRDIKGERIGVARGVTKALVGKVVSKTEGSSEMLYRGLQWASDNGANVISMSLGFDFPGRVKELVAAGLPVDAATSDALEAYRGNLRMFDVVMEMIQATDLLGRNTLVVAAAGNESHRPAYAISAALPAAAVGVISVGGVQRSGRRFGIAEFSNSNPTICAPGVGIRSAKVGGGLRNDSGTSMACPHVAGVAALWWQQVREQNGEVQADLVRSELLASARPGVFVANTKLPDRGAGLVTAP